MMRTRLKEVPALKLLIVLAVFVVFAVRSLVPPGFMLEADVEGAMQIVICTSSGPELKWLTADGGLADEAPGEVVDHSADPNSHAWPCAFASLGLSLVKPLGVLIGLTQEAETPAHPIVIASRPSDFAVTRTVTARAPPA